MRGRWLIPGPALALLLLATGVAAQQPDPAERTGADAESRDSSGEERGDTPESDAGDVRDPERYEASESISEDLSVSFPVDI